MMTSDQTLMLTMSVALILSTIGALYATLVYPFKRLESWARCRGALLLIADDAATEKSPIKSGTVSGLGRSTQRQHLFKVRIREKDGRTRSGYVRLTGHYAEAFWDDSTYDVTLH